MKRRSFAALKKSRSLATLGMTMLLACGTEHERGAMTERTRGREEDRETREGIRASAAEDMTIGRSVSPLRFVRNLTGFQGPESAKYDAEQDVWFVTNMSGAEPH